MMHENATRSEPQEKATLCFSAYYFDGTSSKAHEVQVSVWSSSSTNEALIQLEGDEVDRREALSDLNFDAVIGGAVRKVRFLDGALFETRNQDAIHRLTTLAGKGPPSWVARLENRMSSVLALLTVTVVLVVLGMKFGVPVVAEEVAMALPDAFAHDIGSSTLAILDKTAFSKSEVPQDEQDRLRTEFDKIAERFPQLPLSLYFRKMGLANAFALPDGTVVVTDALLELADNDAQILAILAHEIGHVHHRHGLRMALESASVMLLVSTYIGDVTQIATLTTALPTVLMESKFSRTHEDEADTFALDYLVKYQLDPADFADIMEKLKEEIGESDDPDSLQYLSSHPPTNERILRFRKAARDSNEADLDEVN
ncbi:MAG: M48 family metallopeptidase [Deltaproteobacteria bacterium]|nr:M48 family metallopeptidase [Deltaproteobacteria bacterium]